MNIPCLLKNNLDIFASTADHRVLLGEALFMNTHYPIEFRRFQGKQTISKWNEKKLLDLLIDNNVQRQGNRTYVIFGAAGSGKSEAIRWIEANLKLCDSSRQVVRISRTELDPIIILKKLLSTINSSLSESLIINWNLLKNKPVTLANDLAWNALSSIFESDDQIIPICYKLRPLIENNLRRCFSSISNGEEPTLKSIELISVEELEKTIGEYAFPVNVDYEILRRKLFDRFEHDVLGGYNFVKTLQDVGKKIEAVSGRRPVLLIDDLVQSMSIYASDLLDFFATIEEGNWDIVIGLTPASFESTKRGRELLTRINSLDTFDDRLVKLWLTNESGNESFFLNVDNVPEFITRYMAEYKSQNGFVCGESCSNHSLCKSLQWGSDEDIILSPLNKHLARRMFSNLSDGKGQARQFVTVTGDFINAILDDCVYSFLEEKVSREKYTDFIDNDRRIYVESYMPINAYKIVEIPDLFCIVCGISDNGQRTANIVELSNYESTISDLGHKEIIEKSSELTAVRDWLEGRIVNKELLKPLRSSLNEFLQEFVCINANKMQFTSRLKSTIRKEVSVDGSRIPYAIEDIDTHKGIKVNKSLGKSAIDIMMLKTNKGANQQRLINNLLEHGDILHILKQTTDYISQTNAEFEFSIGMKSDELAFLMYVFFIHICAIDSYPIIIGESYSIGSLSKLPNYNIVTLKQISNSEKDFIINFFKDWFQLRENLYDATRLQFYITNYPSIISILDRLAIAKLTGMSDDYRIGNQMAIIIFKSIIDTVNQYKELISASTFTNYCSLNRDLIKKLSILSVNDILIINNDMCIANKCLLEMGYISYVPSVPEISDIQDSIALKTIDLDYPLYISSISSFEGTSIYKWYLGIKEYTTRIVQDYQQATTLLKRGEFVKLTTIESDHIEPSEGYRKDDIVKSDVYELASTAKLFATRLKMLMDEITNNCTKQVFTTPQNYDRMLAFSKSITVMSPYLSKDEYKELRIDDHVGAVTKYLKCISGGEDNKAMMSISLANLADDALFRKHRDICFVLIGRIRIYQALLYTKIVVGVEQERLISLMKQLKAIQTQKKRIDYEKLECDLQLLSKIQIGDLEISNASKKIIEKLLKGNVYSSSNMNAMVRMLKEIIQVTPYLSNALELSIVLKQ